MSIEWGMRMIREAISGSEFGTNLSSPGAPTPPSPIDPIIGLPAHDVPSQNPSLKLVPAVSSDSCETPLLLHTLISPIAIVDARTRVNNNCPSVPMALIPGQTLVVIYARLSASSLRYDVVRVVSNKLVVFA